MMGPYCKFCQMRCFVPITHEWPEHVREAYGRFAIAAACALGQALEKEKLGYCYGDVADMVRAVQAAEKLLGAG